MKFSDTLISWKSSTVFKHKNKFDSHSFDNSAKNEKTLFVQAAMRNPEFDQTITEVHQRAMQHSTPKEQAAMTKVLEKINIGEVEYEDLTTVETISGNSYKYLFTISPDSAPRHTTTATVFIAFVFVLLIALRIAYAIKNDSMLLLFIAFINIAANAYTFINWPQQVSLIVEKWLQSNNIKPDTSKKMLREVSKKLWFISAMLVIVLIVWLIACHQWFRCYELGVDIVSIIALGVSVLNENIIQRIAICFEKHIYYDN